MINKNTYTQTRYGFVAVRTSTLHQFQQNDADNHPSPAEWNVVVELLCDLRLVGTQKQTHGLTGGDGIDRVVWVDTSLLL